MSENHSMDVAYIAKLASLELSDLREDVATGSISHEEVTRNAPASTDGCIRVPKIIDQ